MAKAQKTFLHWCSTWQTEISQMPLLRCYTSVIILLPTNGKPLLVAMSSMARRETRTYKCWDLEVCTTESDQNHPCNTSQGRAQHPQQQWHSENSPLCIISLPHPWLCFGPQQQQRLGSGMLDLELKHHTTLCLLSLSAGECCLSDRLTFLHKTNTLLQDKRSGELLQPQPSMTSQGPAAPANLPGTATKPTPDPRQERRRTEISSQLQSFIPLSINKTQMVFSLSEDHFAPGKLQSGRETRRQRGEICSCKHFALQTELYPSNQQQMFLGTAGICANQTCLSKRWRHFFMSIHISRWCKQKTPNSHLLEGLKLRENVLTKMVLMRLFGMYLSFLTLFEVVGPKSAADWRDLP